MAGVRGELSGDGVGSRLSLLVGASASEGIVGGSRDASKRIWSGLASGVVLAAVLASGALGAAPTSHRNRLLRHSLGAINQLSTPNGCLVDRSSHRRGCTTVRALKGAGPIIGSEAIVVSPDRRNVYVASSASNAMLCSSEIGAPGS